MPERSKLKPSLKFRAGGDGLEWSTTELVRIVDIHPECLGTSRLLCWIPAYRLLLYLLKLGANRGIEECLIKEHFFLIFFT